MRFFISQDEIDRLVGNDEASLDGDALAVAGCGLRTTVTPAVYFAREVEGKPDPHGLVGKARAVDALAELGADHFRGSVILGDNAYDVLEGYLGTVPEGCRCPAGAVVLRDEEKAAPPGAAPASVEEMQKLVLDTITPTRAKRRRQGPPG